MGFLGNAVVKNPPVNAEDSRDVGWIPGYGKSPRVGHGNPLQYSYLGNPMDRGAWWAPVQGAAESDTSTHTTAKSILLTQHEGSAFVSSELHKTTAMRNH